MIRVQKVKVQPLEKEAMLPYGNVLELKQPLFPEVDPGEGRVAVDMSILRYRPWGPQHDLAIHFSYNQMFIPAKGELVLLVAPPPRVDPRNATDPSKLELDYERIAAFRLAVGQAAMVHRGTWHAILPVGEDCTVITVVRRNPGEIPPREGTLRQGLADRVHSRPYVEYVDIEARDGRVIELELGGD